MKALAQHIHGQKGFARLVVSFREKHSKYSKREIEVKIKQMTVCEKRGADTRLNYYLTKELQEKYGIEVNTHTYIHTYINTYIHTYIHKYIHTYT